jgi:hypothetical protein
MALRVQGVTSAERAAAALGVPPDAAAARLTALARGELAVERTGRIPGFTLTPQGGDTLDKLLAAEGLRGDESLTECYQRFLQLNDRVLKVSSDWQVRREGVVEVPNDHCDPRYDESVVERLAELHASARVCMERVCGCAPRFDPYKGRLDSCVERLRAGDRTAFTAPLAESYHTVWFELHQDLLLTLGLEREA